MICSFCLKTKGAMMARYTMIFPKAFKGL
jgi:hypothetical protein